VIIGAIIIGSFDRILADALTTPLNWLGEQIGWQWMIDHSVTQDRFLIFGLALVLIMVLRPGGLFPSRARAAELDPESDTITDQEQDRLSDVQGRT
jgi:branched-chain amino acid transport system permease protein